MFNSLRARNCGRTGRIRERKARGMGVDARRHPSLSLLSKIVAVVKVAGAAAGEHSWLLREIKEKLA